MLRIANPLVPSTVAPIGAFAIVGWVLVGSGVAHADVIERTFDVGVTGRLVLDSDVGAVEVESNDSGRVEVRVERDGRDADRFEVEFDQRGNEVRVRGELPGRRNWNNRDLEIEFRVSVPRGFEIEVNTSGGSIEVDDLDGDVDVNTAGGFIRMANMGGEVRARTAGGSIDLEESRGNARLNTAGGSISVRRAGGEVEAKTAGGSISIDDAGGSVNARTAGGSIRIGASGGDVVAHTAGGSVSVDDVYGSVDASTNGGSINARIRSQPSGNSELRTHGGSVTVSLAPGVAMDIDAYSSNSRVSSDFEFPASAWDDDRAELRAALNGGGPELSIRASHRIRIKRD
ncbi:MAG: DUF4097 family beta strand repeat-containing protein [Pseudomonadota bacterium]